MAKSKLKDRITVSFYEEIQMNNILLEALNKVAPPRMRGNKLKEWAFEYLKNNNRELFEEVEKDLIKTDNDIEDNNQNISLEINQNKETKQKEKSKLKSKLNIVTK